MSPRPVYDLPDKLHDAHSLFLKRGFRLLVNSQEEMAARIIDLLTDDTKRLQIARSGCNVVGKKRTCAKVG